MKNQINASDVLRQEIENRNLSLRRAAPSFGIPFQQLHAYQTGKHEIETHVLIRIMLKAPAKWAREWAWKCFDARYPGAFIRVGVSK